MRPAAAPAAPAAPYTSIGPVRELRDGWVVGFGRNSAYVVRTDEDDLQYLQKYRLV